MRARFRTRFTSATRDINLLTLARFVTLLGTGMAPVCLAAAALSRHEIGADGLGLALAGMAVGQLGLIMVAGAIADRIGARTAMIAGDVLAFASQSGIALLFASGTIAIWSLVVMSVLLGSADALSAPAATSLVRSVSQRDNLARVNARIRSAGVLARVVGAPLGGLLAALIAPELGLFVDALTFVGSAFLLSRVVHGHRTRLPRYRLSTTLADIREGWNGFRATGWLPPAAAVAAFVNGARQAGLVLIPAVLLIVHRGPEVWGVIFGLQMLGNVVAVWTTARLTVRHGLAWSMAGVASVGAFLLSVSVNAPLLVVGCLALLSGGSISNFGMRVELEIQQTVPVDRIARIAASSSVFSMALGPLATGSVGVLVSGIGARHTLMAWGATAALAALVGAALPALRGHTGMVSAVTSLSEEPSEQAA